MNGNLCRRKWYAISVEKIVWMPRVEVVFFHRRPWWNK